MQKRWSDTKDLGLLASLMDPRFKSLSFVSPSDKEHAFSLIYNLTKLSQEQLSLPTSLHTSLPTIESTEFVSPMLQFFKNFGEISLAEKSELDIYMDLPVHSPTEKNDPILWWKINCNTFPQLSEIARNYLSIPASSTLSERLFSSAGNILTKK